MPDESLTGGTSPDVVTLGNTGNTVTANSPSPRTEADIRADMAFYDARKLRAMGEFVLSGQWSTEAKVRIEAAEAALKGLREELSPLL